VRLEPGEGGELVRAEREEPVQLARQGALDRRHGSSPPGDGRGRRDDPARAAFIEEVMAAARPDVKQYEENPDLLCSAFLYDGEHRPRRLLVPPPDPGRTRT
jgi:hypothetical protein